MMLLIICAPMLALGVVDFVLSPSEWVYALAIVAGALGLIGYNFTVRLVIDEVHVTLRRYGRVVWTVPKNGTEVTDGLAGDLPFIPAVILRRDGKKVGYVLKGWFDDGALAELRRTLAR